MIFVVRRNVVRVIFQRLRKHDEQQTSAAFTANRLAEIVGGTAVLTVTGDFFFQTFNSRGVGESGESGGSGWSRESED